MAKLYPPTIAGTLPSFYKTDVENGTTRIVVPFSMNKTVGSHQIKKFSLRIKTTNTDILYGILESDQWNPKEIANPQVEFDVPDAILARFTIGSFYKVQLAYVDTDDVVGYYSSVGIIKFTAKPTAVIGGFNHLITNSNQTEYIGEYYNELDPSEKVYQYRFCLFDMKNNLLETSGWKIHNTYEDTSLTSSIDKYILRYAFNKNLTYQIQYQVITNNNLQVNSLKYLVMDAESIKSDLKASLVATLDYNNACIGLKLIGEKMLSGAEYAATGLFLLSRASSLDNYATWLPITTFRMMGQLPSKFVFKDYTIAQGATYIYSLQQFNDYKVYSSRILTEPVEAQFEDAYLFDGQRQLRIRFNPKISSFKTILQETKKITIGAKHPYIVRSGATEYKEFPINGLISYKMDENEFFVSKEKELFIKDHEDTFNITDKNVLAERLFKLEVLDWLNNSQPKLFKSPQEGNYIVRLMNVNLTPIDTVSRMLHNFSCQAVEIADYTSDNLIKYNLMPSEEISEPVMRWETTVLQDYQKELLSKGESIYDKDLLRSYKAYYIKFTDTPIGTVFTFNDSAGTLHEIMIGATGAYEVYLDEPIRNLRLKPYNNAIDNKQKIIQGSFTFGMESSTSNTFDTITHLYTQEIPALQFFGPSDNILNYYQNLRRQVIRVLYAKFSKIQVQEVYSELFGTVVHDDSTDDILLNGVVIELNSKTLYDLQKLDEDKKIVHEYYRYFTRSEYVQKLLESYEAIYKTEYNEEKIWTQEEILDNYAEYKTWVNLKQELKTWKEYEDDLKFIKNKSTTFFNTYQEPYDSDYNWTQDEIWEDAEGTKYTQKYLDWLSIREKEDSILQNGQFYTYAHFDTILPGLDYNAFFMDETTNLEIIILDPYTIYRDKTNPNNIALYRLSGNKLVQNKWLAKIVNYSTYRIEYTDLNPYTIYHKKVYDKLGRYIEKYYKYDGVKLINLSTDPNDPTLGYSTKIYYDDVELDVADKEVINITDVKLPQKISIGSGVCAEVGLQIKLIEYQVEELCKNEKTNYLNAFMDYHMAALNLRKLTKDEQKNMSSNGVYFIWRDNNFYALNNTDIVEYRQRTESVYVPTYDVISKKQIKDNYDKMIQTEKLFIEKLEYYLAAYLEDLLK